MVQTDLKVERYLITNSAFEQVDSIPELENFEPMFSFWRIPAFHDLSRTTLFKPKRPEFGKESILAVSRWRRGGDLDKLRDPVERLKHSQELMSTFENSSYLIHSELAVETIANLSSISLPSIRPEEDIIGFDVVCCRSFFTKAFFSLNVSCWCGYPKAWQNSAQQIENFVSRVEENLDLQTKQRWGCA